MVSLKHNLSTPIEAQQRIAGHLRERRLQLNITQRDLAVRAGVPLPTLRKFEQTGLISLASFLKIQMVLSGLTGILDATEPPVQQYKSIEEVKEANRRKAKKRQRSRSKKA